MYVLVTDNNGRQIGYLDSDEHVLSWGEPVTGSDESLEFRELSEAQSKLISGRRAILERMNAAQMQGLFDIAEEATHAHCLVSTSAGTVPVRLWGSEIPYSFH